MFDQDLRDAPDVRQLWNRTHTARKAGRICQCCKEPVELGQQYESWGQIVDGKFEQSFHHRWAYNYPSGCPKFHERDVREMQQ